MKVEGEGSGSHEGMAEMMATPSGGGPGKFVRRLNAVEAELNVYKVKCTSLEKNYESLIAWKNKMDVWLLDSFGLAINCFNTADQNGSQDFDSSNANDNDNINLFPVTPMLIPKSEKDESSIQQSSRNVNGKSLRSKPVVPTPKDNQKDKPKPTLTKTTQKTSDESKKNGINKKTKTVILSSPSSSSSSTPAQDEQEMIVKIGPDVSIELERCDSNASSTTSTKCLTRTPESKNTRNNLAVVPASHPKPIILKQNGEGNDHNGTIDEDDEISIVFSSPPPPIFTPKTQTLTIRKIQNQTSLARPAEFEVVDNNHDDVDEDNNLPMPNQDLFHAETDDPTPCAVCGLIDPEPRNEMVFCEICNLCVHQSCYGVQNIHTDGWKCGPCAAGLKPAEIQCYFCPGFGGALKPVKSPSRKNWAHMSCALWIPEVKPENEHTLEPITNINRIPKDRWKLKCSLCKNPRGACIQCQFNKRCAVAFHVSCAMTHGLEMKEVVSTDESQGVILQAYCKAHTYKPKGPTNKKKRRASTKQNSDDASPVAKKKRHLSMDPVGVHTKSPRHNNNNPLPATATTVSHYFESGQLTLIAESKTN